MADLEICPRYAQFSKSKSIPSSRSFSLLGHLISTYKFSRLTSLNSGCIWLKNCVAKCRRVPGMSIGFHFWQRQSYAFMAGKPAPSSHESPGKWNQEPVILIIGGGVGKSSIWCIQGWPRLRHYTDRWPTTRWRALLLTTLNFIQFHVKYIF